jgi:hypothetical protein
MVSSTAGRRRSAAALRWRPMRVVGWLGVGMGCGLALLIAFALLARFVLHGPVTEESLALSLSRASGSADEALGSRGSCQRARRSGEWLCEVFDGSGVVTYRVQAPGSCWNATRTGGPSTMPHDVSDCVHVWEWSLSSLA